jgi:hypothetical protein
MIAHPHSPSLGEIFDRLVDRATADNPASFVDLVREAGLDPAHDFVGASLSDIDLRCEDLRGFDFTNADLTGADFRGANLIGVSFNDAIRTGALGLPESTEFEITAETVKQFLERRLGSDGRIAAGRYRATAGILKRLGFRDLKQVEAAISIYDDHKLSLVVAGNRQGQTTRFELMLLAALGERYLERHDSRIYDRFIADETSKLKSLRSKGIPTSVYDPKVDATEAS